MNNLITIKNVVCVGNLKNADCVLVSTCEDSFTISPKSTWDSYSKPYIKR